MVEESEKFIKNELNVAPYSSLGSEKRKFETQKHA